jgi:hypothetical protein
MNITENNLKYHVFKCRFPGCNEIFPVESFIFSPITSMGMSYLHNEGVGLSHDLIAVDATCPYCSHTNHFQIKDRIRSISKQEYDVLSNVVLSKLSLIRVTYKILQGNEQAGKTG